MRANDGTRTGGEILIDQLVVHGVKHVFCVPGESYLAALDAFYDRPIELTVCRQEGGATMMAEAVGKVTGRPGVIFCTRGPGATNASPGIHIAKQDSTPLIVFVGQVAREMRDREAFQELDYRAVFGTVAKWATEIDDPARIPEIVSRALVIDAHPEPRLRERSFGDLIGQSSRDLNWAQDPPNGETLVEFVARTRAGLQEALSVQTPTLLIAHGGTLYVLAASLGLSVTEDMIKNATPVWFARSGEGWTSHLIKNTRSEGSANIGW